MFQHQRVPCNVSGALMLKRYLLSIRNSNIRKGVSCDLPGNSVSKWGSPRIERCVQGGRRGGRRGKKGTGQECGRADECQATLRSLGCGSDLQSMSWGLGPAGTGEWARGRAQSPRDTPAPTPTPQVQQRYESHQRGHHPPLGIVAPCRTQWLPKCLQSPPPVPSVPPSPPPPAAVVLRRPGAGAKPQPRHRHHLQLCQLPASRPPGLSFGF